MAHQIEATDQVFTAIEGPAWHGLDARYDHRLTRAEAEAHLNWTVSKKAAELNGVAVPGAWFTIRDDLYNSAHPLNAVLGTVGDIYKPIQNKTLFDVLDAVAETGDAIYETGGSLMGGKRVWLQAKLPAATFQVVRSDWVDSYVTLINGHDGRLMCIITYSMVRVVCANTMAIALNAMGLRDNLRESDEADSSYYAPVIQIRHTPSSTLQLKLAPKALGLAITHSAELQTIFADMALKAMSLTDWREYLKFLFPSKPETEGRKPSAKMQELRDRLTDGFEADINNLDPEHQHTAWTAYNAITDWIDHATPAKSGTDRQDWSWFGEGAKLRQRALTWLLRKIK